MDDNPINKKDLLLHKAKGSIGILTLFFSTIPQKKSDEEVLKFVLKYSVQCEEAVANIEKALIECMKP